MSRPPHVLVLAAAYPSPAEPERAIFIENLNRELLAAAGGDMELSVVAPRVHKGDPLVEVRHGIEIRRFPYPSRGRRLKEELGVPRLRLLAYLAAGLRETLVQVNRRAASLVLCHWVLPTGCIAAVASRILSVPTILYAHGSDLNRYAAEGKAARAAAAWSMSCARYVVAVSRQLRDRAADLGVDPRRIVLIPMGVAHDFAPGSKEDARRRLRLGDGLLFLFVGDLTVEKGVLDVLEALDLLDREGASFALYVAGEGPLGSEITRRGDQLGAHGRIRVRRLGVLPPRELADWYHAADLLLLPSLSEGTPLVVMEALSSGLPVAATRVGGVPDLVEDGHTGLLFDSGRPRALAELLRAVARDPARLEALRETCVSRRHDLSVRRRALELYPFLAEARDGSL